MKYGDQVGMLAVGDAKSGLIRQAKEELQALAEDQAYITGLNLKRIAAQVENLAGFCRFGNDAPPIFRTMFFLRRNRPRIPAMPVIFLLFPLRRA